MTYGKFLQRIAVTVYRAVYTAPVATLIKKSTIGWE